MKKIFPHIFVAIAFCVLIYLGIWQANRMVWKAELIKKIDLRISAEPISVGDYQNIATDEFKLIRMNGKFSYDSEVKLLNRTYNGKPGIHVFTPFKDKSSEKTILVDRGWVKSDTEYEKPEGRQKSIGVIRAGQRQSWIMLDNDPAKNFWMWIELPLMYKTAGALEQEFYVDLKEGARAKLYPLALPKKIELYNEHLQYAITWFSLGIALLIVYYFRFWHTNKSNGGKKRK